MRSAARFVPIATLTAASVLLTVSLPQAPQTRVVVHRAATHDVSPPLASLRARDGGVEALACGADCGLSEGDAEEDEQQTVPADTIPPVPAAARAIEQKTAGSRAAAAVVASFDGLGVGFDGPQGPAAGRNPSDNSLAVGPDRIVQIVNSRLAIFDRNGKVVYGAVPTNSIFQGFGGPCEERNNGDAVVRYDQLADRWLFVMPIFNRIIGRPDEPYAMCYALSEDSDPLGSYYRYEFRRKLFPDYPRPAVWTDGYYVPSSTGDNVIEKHACVVDRANMLKGREASEQCVVVEGVNFLNAADLDGTNLPPTGAPAILLAAGGSQLRRVLGDDGIYAYQFRVSWSDPGKTKLSDPVKIPVAPYHYLCGGQLTRCVPQPGTDMRLDAQGDKIMQRVVYRNFGDRESIVAAHSIDTAGGGGGVRWYELRLNGHRDPALYQQGTYAPDEFFRWMGSPGMDRAGNIAIGYSFGGGANYPGQRFAARLAGDPAGQLTLAESTVAAGAGAQTYGNRWEDYATLAMDPADDCTFWYVGDYYQANAPTYSTRIAAFRMPGCIQHRVSGMAYLDLNHNGLRDAGEPGLAGVRIAYTGAQNGSIVTGANGSYSVSLPADPVYTPVKYAFTLQASTLAVWSKPAHAVSVSPTAAAGISGVDFAAVCSTANRGGEAPAYWMSAKGKAVLQAHDAAWKNVLHETLHVDLGSYEQFVKWMAAPGLAPQIASAALNVALGTEDGAATLHDPVAGDWTSIRTAIQRANTSRDAGYLELLQKLNANQVSVTPSSVAACGGY